MNAEIFCLCCVYGWVKGAAWVLGSASPDILFQPHNARDDHATSFMAVLDNGQSLGPYDEPLDAGPSARSSVGKRLFSPGTDDRGQKGLLKSGSRVLLLSH